MEAVKSTFNAPEVKLHFLDYWRIVRVRKTVIIAVFLLVVITTTLVTFILPESFSSTVRIRVDKDISDVNAWGEQRSISQFDPYWIQTEFETIQSKLILHQVITNLNLSKKWAEKLKEGSEPLPIDFTYAMLKRQVDVSQTRNTSLIEIRVFNRDKFEAAEIANEIARVYRETRFSQKKTITEGGIRTLKAQYEGQDRKFREKQTEVDQIKEKLKIPDVEAGVYYASSSTPEPEVLRKLHTLLLEAKSDYTHYHTLYSHLTNLTRAELCRALATASPDIQLSSQIGRAHV